MIAIVRNSKQNEKGKHLMFKMMGEVFVSFKNAKSLCGYSPSASNKVIYEKVSSKNIHDIINFTKTGKEIRTPHLNFDGIVELAENINQKDKVQNANLMKEIAKEILKEDGCPNYKITSGKIDTSKIETRCIVDEFTTYEMKNLSTDGMISEIKRITGEYVWSDEESKNKWKKLYDKLDESLDESIRKSKQRYERDNGTAISILNYVANHTNLLPLLLQIAKDMYEN